MHVKRAHRWLGLTTWAVLCICLRDPALALQNQLGCLISASDPGTFFDLDKGMDGGEHIQSLRGDRAVAISPNQDRYAHLSQDATSQKTILKLKFVDHQRTAQDILVHEFSVDPDHPSVSLMWAVNGQWVAYLWKEAGYDWLGVADALGSEKRTIPLSNLKNSSIELVRLNTDLTLKILQQDGNSAFAFLSIPDLRLMYQFQPVVSACEMDCSQFNHYELLWAPQTNLFALIHGESGQATQVFIVTPDVKTHLKFSYPSAGFVHAEWSPDSRYLAVLSYGGGRGRLRLDLFGIDGSAITPVATEIETNTGAEGSPYPIIHWSHDSQTIFYMQSSLTEDQAYANSVQRKFVAFRLNEKRPQTLFQNTLWIPEHSDFNKADRFVLAKWNATGQAVAGVLDTKTGRKVALTQEHVSIALSWASNEKFAWAQWDDEQTAQVVWASADGSRRHQIDLPGEHMGYQSLIGSSVGSVMFRQVPMGRNHWEYDSPDGKWRLMYTTRQHEQEHVIRLVDLQSGAYTLLFKSDQPIDAFIDPDSETVAINYQQNGTNYLSLTKLSDRTSTNITMEAPLIAAAWSPDGSMFAYVTDQDPRLDVVSREGKLIRHFEQFGLEVFIHDLRWTACK